MSLRFYEKSSLGDFMQHLVLCIIYKYDTYFNTDLWSPIICFEMYPLISTLFFLLAGLQL